MAWQRTLNNFVESSFELTGDEFCKLIDEDQTHCSVSGKGETMRKVLVGPKNWEIGPIKVKLTIRGISVIVFYVCVEVLSCLVVVPVSLSSAVATMFILESNTNYSDGKMVSYLATFVRPDNHFNIWLLFIISHKPLRIRLSKLRY